jgi:hypothetical protein
MKPNEPPVIEPIGEHTFLIHLSQDGDPIEIVLHTDASTLARLLINDTDEQGVVAATIAFLTDRQRADDLPTNLDLADVAASYDDWTDDMRRRLCAHPGCAI